MTSILCEVKTLKYTVYKKEYKRKYIVYMYSAIKLL